MGPKVFFYAFHSFAVVGYVKHVTYDMQYVHSLYMAEP